MKILLFSYEFANPTLTFVYNEVIETAKKHEIAVLSCNRKNESLFPFEKVILVPFEQNKFLAKLKYKLRSNNIFLGFKSYSFAKQLNEEVIKYNPDVIHSHFGFESLIFLLNFKHKHIPVFITFHGYDASHKLNSFLYRFIIRKWLNKKNIHGIYVSEAIKNNVEKHIGKVERASIVFCGIDIDFYKRTNDFPNKSPYVFLQVSSFVEKKGHEYTLEAFALFLKNNPEVNAKLILAGTGMLLEEMKKRSIVLHIQDNVEFKGLVDKFQIKELLEQAHCFVHHSVTSCIGDTEGIPTALMEAMAMELPVISTIHSGIPELIENNVNGYLVREKDTESYSLALQKVLEWNIMPLNREKIVQKFEMKQHVNQLLEVYSKALNCNGNK